MEIVTAWAAAGTCSLAGRAGCQVTCASTRIAVLSPSCTTLTTSSRESSTAGPPGSENTGSRSWRCRPEAGAEAVPSERTGAAGAWPPRRAPARSARRDPPVGLVDQVGCLWTWSRRLECALVAAGAAATFRAPAGTANEARIAVASASARCLGLAVGRGFDGGEVTVVPVGLVVSVAPVAPVVLATGCATAQPVERDDGDGTEDGPGLSGGVAGHSGAGAGGERAPPAIGGIPNAWEESHAFFDAEQDHAGSAYCTANSRGSRGSRA